MRPKDFWQRIHGGRDPFQPARRIAKLIRSASKEALAPKQPPDATIKYIWIHVTGDGLQHEPAPKETLTTEDWLNIIDESAALGAEWLVIYVGTTLAQHPEVWQLCEWAQTTHGLRVGLHLSNPCLSENDIEHLGRLNLKETYLIAEEKTLESLHFLSTLGVQLCDSKVCVEDHDWPCRSPEDMACVAPDGTLYSCGFVLGNDDFTLGDAREKILSGVMNDSSLPRTIDTATLPHNHGCDACPPRIAKRIIGNLAQQS